MGQEAVIGFRRRGEDGESKPERSWLYAMLGFAMPVSTFYGTLFSGREWVAIIPQSFGDIRRFARGVDSNNAALWPFISNRFEVNDHLVTLYLFLNQHKSTSPKNE